MTGPVLSFLGPTKLELGPAGNAPRQKGWRAARDEDGLLWLLLDVEGRGSNTITEEVLAGLAEQLDRIETDPPRGVVIRSAKNSGFALGADIGMLARMTEPEAAAERLRAGHAVLDRLESLPCPTVAVVHGKALGAGFEIVLSCDACIAIEGAEFGFPEVNLGLHPGLGGSFRLPERIGDTEAMTLMLTGKPAHTAKAKALGIADIVTEERHVAKAVGSVIAGGGRQRSEGLADRVLSLAPARALAARRMRAKVEDRAPQDHYPAPHALIDLWEDQARDRAGLQAAEIASFARLLATDTAQNLIRVFHLRERLKSDAPDEDPVAHVHVIGAGAMGAGIAAWCAMKGKRVTVGDPDWQQLARVVPAAREFCRGAHLSSLQTRDALDRLIPDPQGYGLMRADVVIEAGPEDAEVKAAIYAGAEPRMKPTAILATNTSSLSLTKLAGGLRRPTQFAGLHFFNPVDKMPLVEVVATDRTKPAVANRLAALCAGIGKLPARVGDAPGFLVNRALMPYLLEAVQLIDEGAAKETVDRAAERFGMPTGPVELADRVGLDICLDVADSIRAQVDKPMAPIPDWFRRMVEEKKQLGRKSGQGFYTWSDGEAEKAAGAEGPPDDIADRLVLPMIDACVECLRKGVAEDADRIDAALVFGAGFAPFRGGPLHYARTRGATEVRQRLDALAKAHGERFRPDPGWADFK